MQAPHLKERNPVPIELQPETRAQDILDFIMSHAAKNNRKSQVHNGR